MITKLAAYAECLKITVEKIAVLKQRLLEIRESIGNETKSSAGDKHETARAHLQIEQEQASRQLAEVLAQEAALQLIDIRQSSHTVVRGSLIKTNQGYFFVSIGAGKFRLKKEIIIALSPQSPLGAAFMGLEPGGKAVVNGTTYEITDIV